MSNINQINLSVLQQISIDSKKHYQIAWFRRDLRLHDHTVLAETMASKDLEVIPVFIFDENILNSLEKNDKRVHFIHQKLLDIHEALLKMGTQIFIFHGKPEYIFKQLFNHLPNIKKIVFARDYEPYAHQRDSRIKQLCEHHNIDYQTLKDHCIFEPQEILTLQNQPYKVYTPYSKNWLPKIIEYPNIEIKNNLSDINFVKVTRQHRTDFIKLNSIGFEEATIEAKFLNFNFDTDILNDYNENRDFPSYDLTSLLGIHLRFGTIGIRQVVDWAREHFKGNFHNNVWLKQIIWRDFFLQILWHYPDNEKQAFKAQFRNIQWLNNKDDFNKWCHGQTGYPIVDAGMKQLNETGYMHNRIRMVVASFLCKHLLIDWRWGEQYFAKLLLDFELASNNGNWQWAAGTGCDAAPYFRVFNPSLQQKKFDSKEVYISQWLGDYQSNKDYPKPMVEHKFARERALQAYKEASKTA